MRKREYGEVLDGLTRQLHSFWNVQADNLEWLSEKIAYAVEKTERSFSASQNKYFTDHGFSPYNSVHYSVFLYYLSTAIGDYDERLADQIYYLNKVMNSVDWYWKIELPEHFAAEHPLGTVLGRADYGDYLCVYQGVTIGGNLKPGGVFATRSWADILSFTPIPL